MSEHTTILGIKPGQRARNMLQFREQPMWFLANGSRAFFELERLCGIINAVRRMDYRTPFFIGGGSLFRAAVGSESLGDFDLWIPDGENEKERSISTVILAFEREFPGETPQVVRREKGPTRIACHHYTVELCQVFGVASINALDILSQFDLYASMWGTNGETVVFQQQAAHGIQTGYFYPRAEGGNTAARIKKYQDVWSKATKLEVPPTQIDAWNGIEWNPALPPTDPAPISPPAAMVPMPDPNTPQP